MYVCNRRKRRLWDSGPPRFIKRQLAMITNSHDY